MTQQEKSLLLKDLCGRLPYGVIVTDNRHGNSVITEIDAISNIVYCFDFDEYVQIEKCLPYLHPLSSMTDKEKEELYHYYCKEISDNLNTPNLTWELRCCVSDSFGTDWLNAHHFDYRGLIEKGLALEAPEGMYNTK